MRSLIKLVFSSVSFLRCSLSTFKSFRRNWISRSFDVDILFQTGLIKDWLAFYRFSFPLVLLHKPPINGFLFHFHNSTHIFFHPGLVSHICYRNSYLKMQYSFPLKMFLLIFLWKFHARSWYACEKTFPTGTHIHRHHTGMTCYLPQPSHQMKIRGQWECLSIWTSLLWYVFAMQGGAELYCPDHLWDTWIRYASPSQLRIDIFSINQS